MENKVGAKYANIIFVMLTSLIIVVCFAIQQSWQAMTITSDLQKEISVHCAEQNIRQDWLKNVLSDIQQDVKDIKKKVDSNRGMWK